MLIYFSLGNAIEVPVRFFSQLQKLEVAFDCNCLTCYMGY
jgi:hypothetical protein